MKPMQPEGATPIDSAQLAGLIPDVATQAELNEWEQNNILAAESWLARNKRFKSRALTDTGVRALHRQMFDQTWSWAGTYRSSDTNIGVPWAQVSVEVKKLLDDVGYWIENATFAWNELSARLHHRLVWIHPFAKGNGRHARLYTDVIRQNHGQPRLPWGRGDLVTATGLRAQYLAALRKADAGDFAPLIHFVSSTS